MKAKSMHPASAFVLSMIVPGIAHIRMGRVLGGLIHLLSMLFLWIMGLALKANTPFNFNVEIGVTYIRIAVAVTLLIAFNAYDLAKSLDGESKA